MRLLPASAAVLLLLLATPAHAADRTFDGGTRGCRTSDTRINESSGIALSSTRPGAYWTHNDSGDTARWFLLDASTCATLATYALSTPGTPPIAGESSTAIDWEDMARGTTADGRPTLLFADIGDNAQARPATVPPIVYEVLEPTGTLPPGASATDEQPVPLLARHVLVYPSGPKDAESLLFVPQTRQLGIVTKPRAADTSYTGASELYVSPGPLGAMDGEVIALTKTADLDVKALPRQDPMVPESYATTAGDVAPDGRHVVVRTYFDAYEWQVGPTYDLGAALRTAPTRIPLLRTRQGEGIAYGLVGDTLLTTTEGTGANSDPNSGVLDRYALTVTPAATLPELPLPAVGLVLAGLVGFGMLRRVRAA